MDLSINTYKNRNFYKKITADATGYLNTVEYYKTQDPISGDVSNLKVRETYVYTTNVNTGLVEQEEVTIEWFQNEQSVNSKTITTILSAEEAYLLGQVARTNLISNASMWLFNDLITEYGLEVGEPYAQGFLQDVIVERNLFITGYKDPLGQGIDASVRTGITAGRKTTMKAILQIE